jgi:hypothetical protein
MNGHNSDASPLSQSLLAPANNPLAARDCAAVIIPKYGARQQFAVIAVSNRLSSSLPPRFVMLSGGVLPHIFLNVPFSTTLLSNGAAVLFLLWYVTPRGFLMGAAERARLCGK